MSDERRGSTGPVIAAVLILIVAYIFVLAALIGAYRSESALVPKVVAAEKALADAQRTQGGSAETLQKELASARERLATLRARVPKDMQVNDLYESVTQAAQRNGIADLRFQHKGDTPEGMAAGTYRVHRFAIQGRGSYDKLTAFIDSVQKEAGATTLLENLNILAAGNEFQMSADIVVYVLGG